MNLIAILVPLLILGVVLWGVNAIDIIEPNIKKIINIVAIVIAVIWLLQVFVGHTGMPTVRP